MGCESISVDCKSCQVNLNLNVCLIFAVVFFCTLYEHLFVCTFELVFVVVLSLYIFVAV